MLTFAAYIACPLVSEFQGRGLLVNNLLQGMAVAAPIVAHANAAEQLQAAGSKADGELFAPSDRYHNHVSHPWSAKP